MKKDIEKIIEKINWVEFHELIARQDGMVVWVHTNGSLTLNHVSSYPDPYAETQDVVAMVKTVGNNRDDSYYISDDWEEQEDGTYITESGRVLTLDGAILECIRDDDHDDMIEVWKAEIRKDHDNINITCQDCKNEKHIKKQIKDFFESDSTYIDENEEFSGDIVYRESDKDVNFVEAGLGSTYASQYEGKCVWSISEMSNGPICRDEVENIIMEAYNLTK